jgi:myo-inositol-1(or 4)-monophosphatase
MNNLHLPLPEDEFRDLLDAAHSAADSAAAVILPHFRAGGEVAQKGGGPFDPVTEADKAAERIIRQKLSEHYPDCGIIGEEFGSEGASSKLCWTIDPIDGTRAFILGQPLWGTLIGLLYNGRPLLGLMHQPFTRERFWSGHRAAYWRHGSSERPIHTRPCESLADAMLASTGPDFFAEGHEHDRFDALSKLVRMRRFGGDCYNYCLLADGHIDLVVEAGLHAFDIVPLIPIIERAGGIVTDWEGGSAAAGGRILAAGDPRVHAAALEVLAG